MTRAPRHNGWRVKPRNRNGLIAALDVGTAKVCCLIARTDGAAGIEVVGIGHQVARGMRSGAVVDMAAVEDSIRAVVHSAEEMAGETVRSVVLGVTGCQPLSRTVAIELSIDGHEVGEADLKQVFDQSRAVNGHHDRMTLHALPVGYEIDGLRGVRDPRGMRGERLRVRMHVVAGARSPIRNLTNCVGRCHLDTDALVLSAYAAGLTCLVEDELDLGAVCVDMGAGATSIAAFQGGALVHADSVAIGGWHVTSDIARGLATPMRDAERLKTLLGNAVASPADDKDMIDVPQLGESEALTPNHLPRSALVEIVRPRIEETLELVHDRLRLAGFDGARSFRVVLTGGASQLNGVRDLAAEIIGRQVRLGGPGPIRGLAQSMRAPPFAACAGLLAYAARQDLAAPARDRGQIRESNGRFGRIGHWFRENF